MPNNLIIGTSFCSLNNYSGHSHVSKQCYSDSWLRTIWREQIEKYIVPAIYYVYVSAGSDIYPIIDKGFEYNVSLNDVHTLDHRYHYHAALLQGTIYAYNNDCNFLWIESDCMIRGLDKLYNEIQASNIAYGFGRSSYNQGWASQSVIFVNNKYLSEFINKIIRSNIQKSTIGMPEKIFHEIFKDEGYLIPYGYDRKRPIKWDDPIFWEQQINDYEITTFRKIY